MIVDKKILKKISNQNVKFITIDGITCGGKTTFAKILQKKLIKYFPGTFIISKDLFLYSRTQRIKITKKFTNNKTYNQNILHYDVKKIKLLLNFLVYKSKKKKLTLNNLYNRKTGKNNFKYTFRRSINKLIILEGIYINKDIKLNNKSILRILLIKDVYKSLFSKIKRIRDKKISIQLLISEFINIHLNSYKKYLSKQNFDLYYKHKNNNFHKIKDGRSKQLKDILLFFNKHIINKKNYHV